VDLVSPGEQVAIEQVKQRRAMQRAG